MVLGVVVGHVSGPWSPEDMKLILFDAILHPVESHVNGFRSYLFALFIGNRHRCGIVNLDWSGRLGVAKFVKNIADIDSFLAIVKEGTNFGVGESFQC